jgi:hypothetical protein
MCQTDIHRFFPSINLEVMDRLLTKWGCDPSAVVYILEVLRYWHTWQQLQGLPIGPEVSKVLGVAMLIPFDERVAACRLAYLRWMDDILLFGSDSPALHRNLEPLDEELARLRLRRSYDKTKFLDDRESAIEAIHKGSLTSTSVLLRVDASEGRKRLHRMFDQEVRGEPDPNPSIFRWILRTLTHTADPYAVAWLADDPERMTTDPVVAMEYLNTIGLTSSGALEPLLHRLESRPDERTESVFLRLLVVMDARLWGRAEGQVVENLALDQGVHPPTRGWAWEVVARCGGWRPQDSMDACLEEDDPLVQRAQLATIRHGSPRTRRAFLRHVRTVAPHLRFTARWLEAA